MISITLPGRRRACHFADRASARVPRVPQAHRLDGMECAGCQKWLCAWHYWVGDDEMGYCPKCAPAYREDGQPSGVPRPDCTINGPVHIRFVVTVTDGRQEWDCPVHDPKLRPVTWDDIYKGMAADPRCPFSRNDRYGLRIKSNWQKEDS